MADLAPSHPVVVFRPDGSEDMGRVIASHVMAGEGVRGIGSPKRGSPPAIVDIGGTPVLFGSDGWELHSWGKPMPREQACCLCPEAGASEASS
jgi:hypothetical protein